MTSHYFNATIVAWVYFSDEEFEFLFDCCKHHYDHTVKSLARQGGVMWGALNRRNFSNSDEDKYCELPHRKIDLLLKALEMSDKELSYKLSKDLRAIIEEIRSLSFETNANINSCSTK